MTGDSVDSAVVVRKRKSDSYQGRLLVDDLSGVWV